MIEAVFVQGNPNHALGRPAKVGKEEMVGLVTALELYVQRDHQADFAGWVQQAEAIAEDLKGIEGIYAREVHDDTRWSPQLVISFEGRWRGRAPGEIAASLRSGDPAIYLTSKANELTVAMITLEPRDAEVVARRLREELTK